MTSAPISLISLQALKEQLQTSPPAFKQYFNALAQKTRRDPHALVDPLQLPSLAIPLQAKPLVGGAFLKTTLMSIRIKEGAQLTKGLLHKDYGVPYAQAVKMVQEKIKSLHKGHQKIISLQINTTSHVLIDNFMHVVITHAKTNKYYTSPKLSVFAFNNWEDMKNNLKSKLQDLTNKKERTLISISVDHQTRASKKRNLTKSVLLGPLYRPVYDFLTPKERLNVFMLHRAKQSGKDKRNAKVSQGNFFKKLKEVYNS